MYSSMDSKLHYETKRFMAHLRPMWLLKSNLLFLREGERSLYSCKKEKKMQLISSLFLENYLGPRTYFPTRLAINDMTKLLGNWRRLRAK